MGQPAAPLTEFGHDIVGPTASRPAYPDIGCRYFDTDLNHVLVYNGTAWQNTAKIGSFANTLTALASGGQAGATPVTAMLNEFTVVANDHDSCLLPVSVAGMWVNIANFGGHSLDIYAAASEVINAISALSPYTLNNAKTVLLFCPKAGQWYTNLTA